MKDPLPGVSGAVLEEQTALQCGPAGWWALLELWR